MSENNTLIQFVVDVPLLKCVEIVEALHYFHRLQIRVQDSAVILALLTENSLSAEEQTPLAIVQAEQLGLAYGYTFQDLVNALPNYGLKRCRPQDLLNVALDAALLSCKELFNIAKRYTLQSTMEPQRVPNGCPSVFNLTVFDDMFQLGGSWVSPASAGPTNQCWLARLDQD